jgi:hypothetical protein
MGALVAACVGGVALDILFARRARCLKRWGSGGLLFSRSVASRCGTKSCCCRDLSVARSAVLSVAQNLLYLEWRVKSLVLFLLRNEVTR